MASTQQQQQQSAMMAGNPVSVPNGNAGGVQLPGQALPQTVGTAPGQTALATAAIGATPAVMQGGPGQPGAQFQSASLYVGDLHPDVTEALLYEIFNAVGPVASIRVCRDAVTRRSLGYAYVNFHNQSDAERALDTMNYTIIRDRPCRMMWSQRDPSLRKNGAGNVFVKNLDLSIDNKALYDTFSLFGNILSCKVVTDREGKSKGYGFVHFETVEAANEAIRKINGMLIANKEVYVGPFQRRNERPSATDWTNVYVKNIPKSWDKDKLDEVFSVCGPISSAVVMVDNEGKSRGFGFVDFVDHDSADKAVKEMNNYEVDPEDRIDDGDEEEEAAAKKEKEESEKQDQTDGNDESSEKEKTDDADDGDDEKQVDGDVSKENGDDSNKNEDDTNTKKTYLFVSRAQKKTERERELAQKFEQLKVERINKYQGVNLYVKNLDESVDDDLLRNEFSQFGSITSARVMRDQIESKDGSNKKVLGPSKGFGFVCFSTPEEAIRAVTEMNGRMIKGKPVYVALAQRKDARRAQLEAQHQQRVTRAVPGMQPMYPGAAPFMYAQGGLQPGMPPQARQNFAFMPQQMMPPRGMVQQPRGMPGAFPARGYPMAAAAQPGAYPTQQPTMINVPQQAQNPAAATAAAAARGARRPRTSPTARVPGQQNNFKYTQNVRNQPMGMSPQGPPSAAPNAGPTSAPAPAPAQPEPLSAAALASASSHEQKNMIGEKLYPLVHAIEPQLAGKITGMLLEMDNPELLHLLESPDSLMAKITEALQVLKQHGQG